MHFSLFCSEAIELTAFMLQSLNIEPYAVILKLHCVLEKLFFSFFGFLGDICGHNVWDCFSVRRQSKRFLLL